MIILMMSGSGRFKLSPSEQVMTTENNIMYF